LGYTCTQLTHLGEASHRFTHLKWNMVGYLCHIEESFTIANYTFTQTKEISNLAMPSALRKFIAYFC